MMRIVPPLLEHARKPHSDYGSGFLTAPRSSDSTYSRYVSSSTPSSRLKNPLPRYQKRVSRHALAKYIRSAHYFAGQPFYPAHQILQSKILAGKLNPDVSSGPRSRHPSRLSDKTSELPKCHASRLYSRSALFL